MIMEKKIKGKRKSTHGLAVVGADGLAKREVRRQDAGALRELIGVLVERALEHAFAGDQFLLLRFFVFDRWLFRLR